MKKIVNLLLLSLLCTSCALSEGARKEASYHYQMGLSYLGEKNYTSALVEFTDAEKISPNDPDLLNQLGLAYYYKKRYDLAEEKYLKAIDRRKNFSEARNNLGVVYMEMKRWDDAIRQFRVVTDDLFYPNGADASINLGLSYLGKGDQDNALAILRGVVTSYPENPVARLNLGRTYFAGGKTDLAITEYREALNLYHDFANAYYYLGVAYIKKNEQEEARKAFQEVVRLKPYSDIGQVSKEYLDTLR